MNNSPKISVVMTVFNGELFLKEAIDSILGQSFEDFEFIIVDNASTDRSREIIASYKDARMIFIENDRNLGQSKALNIGIKKAKGEFIARMDADDISLPRRFQEQYDYLQKNDSIAVVGSWYLEIDEKGRVIREFRLPTDPWEIKAYLIGSSALSYHCIPHPIVLMRKKALFDVCLFNEKYIAQDFDLWLRLSRKYLLANLGEVLFKYRINSLSQSARLTRAFRDDCKDIIGENIKYFWPDIKEKEFLALARMLQFLPQESADDGNNVYLIFENFLDKIFSNYKEYPQAKKAVRAMKAYYIPNLFFTNKRLTLLHLLRLVLGQPAFLLKKKMYAKVYKAIQNERRKEDKIAAKQILPL